MITKFSDYFFAVSKCTRLYQNFYTGTLKFILCIIGVLAAPARTIDKSRLKLTGLVRQHGQRIISNAVTSYCLLFVCPNIFTRIDSVLL